MLGRLLCWLGFHDWSWTHEDVSILGQCVRCKLILKSAAKEDT